MCVYQPGCNLLNRAFHLVIHSFDPWSDSLNDLLVCVWYFYFADTVTCLTCCLKVRYVVSVLWIILVHSATDHLSQIELTRVQDWTQYVKGQFIQLQYKTLISCDQLWLRGFASSSHSRSEAFGVWFELCKTPNSTFTTTTVASLCRNYLTYNDPQRELLSEYFTILSVDHTPVWLCLTVYFLKPSLQKLTIHYNPNIYTIHVWKRNKITHPFLNNNINTDTDPFFPLFFFLFTAHIK